MTVLVELRWLKGTQFLSATGVPLAAGTINIYDATTTNLRTTYLDYNGVTPNTLNVSNQIVLDSGGKLDESVYVPIGRFKFVLKDSLGSTVETEDNILGALDTSVFLTGSVTAEFPVISKTSDYTIQVADESKVINANPTGGTFTLTLPSAVTAGDGWSVTMRHTGTANTVAIISVSSQTISGPTSRTLSVLLDTMTLVSDGANWHIKDWVNRTFPFGLCPGMVNGTIAESHTGNAATFAVKTLAGADPSSSDPVFFLFRNSTAATGDYVLLQATAALSLTLSSGSTMGFTNSVAARLWLVVFNDAGTLRLGAINCLSSTSIYPLGQFHIASSTAEGGAGAADSAHVFYTGSAVSSKAYEIIGYASYETGLGTVGAWTATPTRMQLFSPGVPLPGATIQLQRNQTGSNLQPAGVAIPYDDTIPLVGEGASYFTQAITPTSTANLLEISHLGNYASAGAGNQALTVALFQDSTAVAAQAVTTMVTSSEFPVSIVYTMLAGTTSSTTFSIRAGDSSADTITLNGAGGGRKLGGVLISYLAAREIMA